MTRSKKDADIKNENIILHKKHTHTHTALRLKNAKFTTNIIDLKRVQEKRIQKKKNNNNRSFRISNDETENRRRRHCRSNRVAADFSRLIRLATKRAENGDGEMVTPS